MNQTFQASSVYVPVNPPRIMTTTELAKTGILSMGTIRAGIKEGWIPHKMRGNRAYINYDKLLKVLEDF